MATITKESVFSAADALEARGLRVSVRTVRDHLGGGSPNQITPLVALWREKKPQVALVDIQLIPELENSIAEMRRYIARQVESSAGESARRADERASEAEDTLLLCQQENGEITEQLAASVAALEDVRAQREQLSGTITELREDLVRTRKEALEEVDASAAKAEREREAAESARQALARAELRLEALPRLETEIEQLRNALAEAQAGRVAAEQTAAVGQARLEAAERRAEAAEGDKGEFKAKLEAVTAKFETTLGTLEKTSSEAKASTIAAQSAQARLESMERELVSAKAEAGEAKAELKELRAEIRGKAEKADKK